MIRIRFLVGFRSGAEKAIGQVEVCFFVVFAIEAGVLDGRFQAAAGQSGCGRPTLLTWRDSVQLAIAMPKSGQ